MARFVQISVSYASPLYLIVSSSHEDSWDSFTALGFVPMMRISRKLGLPKSLGRFLAVYCVFILSAWMHVQGMPHIAYLAAGPVT
jgi:hypothetical protein